eukprot:1149059-Pyramimonas_sp.AAC.3
MLSLHKKNFEHRDGSRIGMLKTCDNSARAVQHRGLELLQRLRGVRRGIGDGAKFGVLFLLLNLINPVGHGLCGDRPVRAHRERRRRRLALARHLLACQLRGQEPSRWPGGGSLGRAFRNVRERHPSADDLGSHCGRSVTTITARCVCAGCESVTDRDVVHPTFTASGVVTAGGGGNGGGGGGGGGGVGRVLVTSRSSSKTGEPNQWQYDNYDYIPKAISYIRANEPSSLARQTTIILGM